ncbi:MAG TPA: hypothetical protein PKD00_00820 [Burkholderiales bacterium]|nr:hypothetical protein [Burkholderiales bacterium]
MRKTQSVLLGLREKLEKTFQGMLDDYLSKFKNKQGIFQGWNKTYTPMEGFADDPTKRSFQRVSGTVSEQLEWFKENTEDYFKTVLSIEKTNSTGIKAELFVEGVSWGEYTVLELLRLKTILDGKLKAIIGELPIRDEKVIWTKTTKDYYGDRNVWETPIVSGFTKTTLKRTEIVHDPHIKDAPNRPPVSVQIELQVNTGEFEEQRFSGEITMLERAKIIARYDKVYTGIIEALETANSVETVESDLGTKFINYLFK